jgi:hypothetical protein
MSDEQDQSEKIVLGLLKNKISYKFEKYNLCLTK